MRLVGLRLMTVLSAAVYKKSLLLSAAGRQEYTAGQVVNLIAVDCSKVCRIQRFSSSYTFLKSLQKYFLFLRIILR
jgi:hypothetical protein